MMNVFRSFPVQNPLTLSLLSGVLLALAYMIPALWIVSFFALVPLLFALKNGPSLKKACALTMLSHGILVGTAYAFLFTTHPVTWAGIEGTLPSLLLITTFWLLAIFSLTPLMGFWGAFVSRVPHQAPLFFSLLATTLWVTVEITGSILLSLVFSGPGIPLTAGWTIGHIGYTLAEFPPLLALSSVGGVYLLSFFIIFTNCAVFFFIQNQNQRRYRWLYVSLAFLVVFSLALYGINRVPHTANTLTIANTYTTFEPDARKTEEAVKQKWLEIDALMRDIRESAKEPDIVLIPETVDYMSPLADAQKEVIFDSLSDNVVVINSEQKRLEDDSLSSTLAFYASPREEPERNVKQLIIPGGEYIPYIAYWFGNLTFSEGWSERFEAERTLTPGSSIELGDVGGTPFAALACSESISPFLYQRAARKGATVFFNSASHAVFGTSDMLVQQFMKFTRVRAAENNRYLVQASNVAPSYVITNRGHLRDTLSGTTHNARFVTVSTLETMTLYTRLGHIVPVFFVVLTLVLSTGYVFTQRRGVI